MSLAICRELIVYVVVWAGAEGGVAQQAIGVATARALAQGGPQAQSVARALAIAIAIYGCPGVKPVISSESPISLHLHLQSLVARLLKNLAQHAAHWKPDQRPAMRIIAAFMQSMMSMP